MGTSAYLRESTAELLTAIEQELPMESKATIIHKSLEVYAQSLFDLSSPDTPDVLGALDSEAIRESGREGQARIRLYTDEEQINAPDSIGKYECEKCEYNLGDDDPQVNIRYQSESNLWVLLQNSSNDISLGRLVDGELETSESFDDLRPAIARLNANIVPLEQTTLSVREHEVWWLTREYSHKRVAEWLGITEDTVNTHLSNIAQKRQDAQQTLNLLNGNA
jgi:Bacterial regulatory proteins, luxR family.